MLAALEGPAVEGHTTNLVTADSDGNVCVLTSSLGLGTGDFLAGLDLHLNSMLGEVDLLRAPLLPGERMESMMAPSLAVDGRGGRAGDRLGRRDAAPDRARRRRGGDPGRRARARRKRSSGHGSTAQARSSTPSPASTRRRWTSSSAQGSRCAAGRRSITTSAASACCRPPALPVILGAAGMPPSSRSRSAGASRRAGWRSRCREDRARSDTRR